MEPITAALIEHGYVVLFALVLLDQLGLPVPALPVVIAAGGLAGLGRLDPLLAVGVATIAATLGDWVWYELGRKHGVRIVRMLCKVALEPDSCVRSTQGFFARHGPRSLLVSKWIPGLQTVAPPLAGAAKMARAPFFAYSVAGGLFWSGVLIAAGYALRNQLGMIADLLAEFGVFTVVLMASGLGLYIGWKVVQRHRFIRTIRGARISPIELRDRLEASEPVEVVDLRHPIDFATDPYVIPGARRLEPEELERRHAEIPRDRDIVLYCT